MLHLFVKDKKMKYGNGQKQMMERNWSSKHCFPPGVNKVMSESVFDDHNPSSWEVGRGIMLSALQTSLSTHRRSASVLWEATTWQTDAVMRCIFSRPTHVVVAPCGQQLEAVSLTWHRVTLLSSLFLITGHGTAIRSG